MNNSLASRYVKRVTSREEALVVHESADLPVYPHQVDIRWNSNHLTRIGAIGAGDFVSPVLVPGGRIAIVAIGRAKWVWDVDKGRWKG